jgi:hypothetical protein
MTAKIGIRRKAGLSGIRPSSQRGFAQDFCKPLIGEGWTKAVWASLVVDGDVAGRLALACVWPDQWPSQDQDVEFWVTASPSRLTYSINLLCSVNRHLLDKFVFP